MTNKDLFKEAIADAKQVREAALANAKNALEEALTPRLQSMLSMKLEEMENEGDVDYTMGRDDDDQLPNPPSELNIDINEEDEELEEDFDLSAILRELEDENTMDEAEDTIAEAEEPGEEEAGEEEMESEDEEVNVADLSVEDLKDMIKDIISQEMGDEEMVDGEEMSDDDDEINLDELLAELDALEEAKEDKVEEAKKDEELEEAISTINTLRSELQEVNLLNAKLLYVNKIFKAKNLTESQKVKVIASFDKATTAKEAKIIFESLESTLTAGQTSTKSQIKESLGFASKAAGVAPKKQIVEVNDSISRMQRLAGIKIN